MSFDAYFLWPNYKHALILVTLRYVSFLISHTQRQRYFCPKGNKIGRLWSPCLRVNYVFYGRPKVTLSRSLRRSLMQAFIAAFICISSCIHRWIEVAWIGRASSSKIRFFYEYDWLPKVNTVVIIFSVWLSTHNLSHPLLICTWFLKNRFGKIKFGELDF